ncbi:recombinase [Pandoraea cepalis]|uniref:Recombinase n=1 Tax=Pandoraea cepalis TaxID=2508294 RepID=A0A5E4XMB4_9BURK|nr:hypothetical protein [Pandoraea cepalis]VVE37192.1 recombinase [Pandoraea cepalis]
MTSAAEFDSAVLDQLRAILRFPGLLGDLLPRAVQQDPSLDEAKGTVAMTRLKAIWDQLFPAEQITLIKPALARSQSTLLLGVQARVRVCMAGVGFTSGASRTIEEPTRPIIEISP